MNLQDLIAAAVLLAPGFLTLKLFYLFGIQRPRSQWEWTTWSVLVSFPIDWFVRFAAFGLASTMGISSDAADIALRVLIPIGLAFTGSAAWAWVRRSDRPRVVSFRRALTDSAWDEVLDQAHNHQRQIEVVTDGPNGEIGVRGYLGAAGREDAQAEPWVYLRKVKQKLPGEHWQELEATHGVLVHRDQIRRIRIRAGPRDINDESSGEAATEDA